MSIKRSRATYEADLQAQQSPFVFFGTALPPLDPEVRDDGSYVPVWKQEVRDERGRKRLHGAFTGGWSAGYFNTVGSKDGWTPSTFVSSRTNRRKDDSKSVQQRPEDYMDDEDLADAEESRKLHTSQMFAGLGLTEDETTQSGGLAGLFRVEGETMGTRLLKKMGWKEGQGIGPRIRRAARLDAGRAGDVNAATHLFAPENIVMIRFTKKTDRKGLGYEGAARLAPIDAPGQNDDDDSDGKETLGMPPPSVLGAKKKKEKQRQGGMGVGVLNDTGSDDDDPYEMGPRISYTRVIGGEKKKKKKKDKETLGFTSANPLLKSKPVFLSKKAALGRLDSGLRRGHDGRRPLDGFVFGQKPDPLTMEISAGGKYAPPMVPPGWKSSKAPKDETGGEPYTSTADAAKASKLDPRARAAALGEQQLPGKSVFDFMSSSSRDRLAAATGKTDLPEAKGEVPQGHAVSEADKLQELLREIPRVDKETALAAIARGASGGAPYSDDEAKRSRYRAYLENQAGTLGTLPAKPSGMSNDDWLQEFHEFYNCARIFKPMSGFMASRFTTSSGSKLATGSSGQVEDKDLVTRPPPKPRDPAEEAAKLGMFGHMTRSVQDFYPTRLLCKRLNVKPPAHVQQDQSSEAPPHKASSASFASYRDPASDSHDRLRLEYSGGASGYDAVPPGTAATPSLSPDKKEAPFPVDKSSGEEVDTGRNEALESQRAGEEIFQSIFGDGSDEEDD